MKLKILQISTLLLLVFSQSSFSQDYNYNFTTIDKAYQETNNKGEVIDSYFSKSNNTKVTITKGKCTITELGRVAEYHMNLILITT